jgi:hypothetical protein
MRPIKEYFNRRLTGREIVVVIVALAMLGGSGYLAYQFIAAKMLEAQVDAAMPKVCDAVRDQRAKLVSAIEAYKAHFGVYPPDHLLSRKPLVVDPDTNTLFYELVGTIYNPTTKIFQVGGMEAAEEKYVKEFFQCDGFKNCGETTNQIKQFLAIEPLPARQLHDDPDVFAVGFRVPYEGFAPVVVWEFEASPWRYVSSSPTNNPGKFDLWMELKTKKRTVVIGNWKAVE